MSKTKNVLNLSLPQRVKLIDYIRGRLALSENSPLGALEDFCEEVKRDLGFEVNRNILKSTCDALEIRLDDIIEREFSRGSPVSLLHVRLNKLEKIVQEQGEMISKLRDWTDYDGKQSKEGE